MSLAVALARGCADLGLQVPDPVQSKLIAYIELIAKWNRIYNLTAVREPARMVASHLLDCLAIMPQLDEVGTVIDVGSGAGLPGIPLALMWPRARVTLLDSNHKKATFLRQAAIELALDNADVVCERIETWQAPRPFDLVVSRAFSDLGEFARIADRLCASAGTMAAMKGVYPHEELAQLPPGIGLKRVVPLKVPGLRAERHLVLLEHVH